MERATSEKLVPPTAVSATGGGRVGVSKRRGQDGPSLMGRSGEEGDTQSADPLQAIGVPDTLYACGDERTLSAAAHPHLARFLISSPSLFSARPSTAPVNPLATEQEKGLQS